MNGSRTLSTCLVAAVMAGFVQAHADNMPDAEIELSQPGVTLTLLAEHPEIVTPTGIDIDQSGNIWAVASHTHFRPSEYDGPEHDEILRVFVALDVLLAVLNRLVQLRLEVGPRMERRGVLRRSEVA